MSSKETCAVKVLLKTRFLVVSGTPGLVVNGAWVRVGSMGREDAELKVLN